MNTFNNADKKINSEYYHSKNKIEIKLCFKNIKNRD